jgi:hypothetical protein
MDGSTASAELLGQGYVRVAGALDGSFCEAVARDAFARLEVDESDPSTWPAGPVHLPVVRNWDLAEVAPDAMAALDVLVGGADAVRFAGVQDNLIVNFPDPVRPWWPPSAGAPGVTGWHKDGDWFRHFLDSPEQGLLVIVFWRDVAERQGATYVAVDSIGPVAELLASEPGGLDPAELVEPNRRIIAGCGDFRALTGRQGDIVFAHPFLLHTASANGLGAPRVISNSSVMLAAPMRFDRSPGQHTAVEQSILDALGARNLEFVATGPRRKVASDRARRWRDTRQGESPG